MHMHFLTASLQDMKFQAELSLIEQYDEEICAYFKASKWEGGIW